MVLREGRQAVVTLIEYIAAFDPESQLVPDSALAGGGTLSSKVRCIVQAIFAAATGVVRRISMLEPFNIDNRRAPGGYILARRFIAELDRIFRLYDHVNPGMVLGTGALTVHMTKIEYDRISSCRRLAH